MKKSGQDRDQYDSAKIEAHWRGVWEKAGIYQPDIKTAKTPFYNLMMFPYPSAEGLHVGNVYAFCGSDIYGRYSRMMGFDVFEPIGLDGFGIHSENYALKIGEHPAKVAKRTEKNFYRQLRLIGNGFAWRNKLETYDSNYYKWTQWIFVQMFKAGLAYRKKASVNWCPSCRTVLADEQVIPKRLTLNAKRLTLVCERCHTSVIKRELEQWFFRITDYADRLMEGLSKIDWSERVKIAQRNWLGKSEGIEIVFTSNIESNASIHVFTTRVETIFGVTFMALAPEHLLVPRILSRSKGLTRRRIQRYLDYSKNRTLEQRQLTKNKSGVLTGFHCINPISSQKVPMYIADYVLPSYGTGAIMGVPAHDEHDWEFAKKYHIDIVEVIRPQQPKSPKNFSGAYTGEGVLINSGKYNGKSSAEAVKILTNYIEREHLGQRMATWHLRDWIISRQRYWGPPIPMIFCQACAREGKSWFATEEAKQFAGPVPPFPPASARSDQYSNRKQKEQAELRAVGSPSRRATRKLIGNWKLLAWRSLGEAGEIGNSSHEMAGWYPVPEGDLPVELPYIENFKPTGTGVSPLAQDKDFVRVACPECVSEARRETDVSDTFLDSAWYFLRYPSVGIKAGPVKKNFKFQISNFKLPWDREITSRWLPVDMYIGGAEHAVLHLLYSRFLTMALYDMGLVDFEEPFTTFRAHGLLIAQGAKMSKSRGNIVNPDIYIKKYGADVLRCYLMFCGRFEQGGDFRDTGIEGMSRFLKRVWRLVTENGKWKMENGKLGNEAAHMMHKTMKRVTEDIEGLDYNTAIAAIMEWVNALEERNATIDNLQLTIDKKNKSNVRGQMSNVSLEELQTLLLLLAPFAPHMTEELWQTVRSSEFVVRSHNKNKKSMNYELPAQRTQNWSIHLASWPKYDAKLAKASQIVLVVEVNGKVRDKVMVETGISREKAEKLALSLSKVTKYLSGGKFKKVIFVPDRLINFVV